MPRKKCQCGKISSFNVDEETKPICCKVCKTDDMVNVVSRRCSCGNRSIYNVTGQKTPMYCSKCKTDDMIDVVSKKCPCGNRPIYNANGKKTPLYCSKCKVGEMIDVVNKRCPCGTRSPVFNVPGETKGVCCSKCKSDNMIDVVHKRCSCGKHSKFNVPGELVGVCCSECKTGEMINVVSKVCPGYNTKCPVRTYVGRGHEYCMSCDPNDARRKQYKRYEEAFFAYIKDKLDVHKREFRVTFDPNDTAKKCARLDGVVFGDGVIVCIEVDENGHQDYECEEHRMHLVTAELLQKYPEHVVSWVRINPTIDAKSQWSKTSKQIREKRFEYVVDTVRDILNMRDTCIKYIGFE